MATGITANGEPAGNNGTEPNSPSSVNSDEIAKLQERIAQLEREKLQAEREIDARMKSVDQACIVSETDLKGYITYANEKFCEVSQYTPEELIGANQNIVRHPDMPKELFKEMWASIGKGQIFRGIVKNRKKDGSPYYIDGVFTPVLGENGKPIKYIGIRYDITEATLESQRMKGIVDAIDNSYAFIEFDTKGTIIAANDNFLQATGYTKQEIAGKHHRLFVDPAYANTLDYQNFWSDLENGKVFKGEFKRLKKTGEAVYLQAVYSPVKDDMGRIIKVVKIATDVTAQVALREEAKQAAEELKAQEEELRQNMEEMQATQEEIQRNTAAMKGIINAIDGAYGYIEFDNNGSIISANSNFLQVTGYTLDEIKGKHHRLFLDASESGTAEYSKFWAELADGKVHSGQFRRKNKSGEDIWLQAAYSPVRDINGKVVKVIKIAMDVTVEKERAAQMQREIEARMASVDRVCIVSEVDLKGHITYVNDKHCEVSQYTREELIGANQNIVRHPDMPKELFKEMWATIGKGKIFTGKVKNKRKDGTPYYVDGVFTPVLGKNGKPVKYIGIRYDITAETYEKQRMQGVVDAINSSFSFVEFDLAGNIVDTNEIMRNALGYSKEEVHGKNHRAILDSNYANSSKYDQFWKDLLSGKQQLDQYKFISKSGKEVWFQAAYSPITDDMGRITKVIQIATDITLLKQILSEVSRVAENLAQGDLTTAFTLQASGDIALMGDAFNTAISNLNTLLSNISQIANLVASSSEQLLTKGEQMKSTTQEVASATQEMAEGAQQQAQQTDESSKLIDMALKSSNEMGKKADIIANVAERALKSATEGLVTIKKVVENMNDIQQSAQTTSGSISILTQRSEEIARTLNVITDIAAQTNLLALNAAIEAARAGDAGRGFAVVAEEIRKLAEDSRKSAVDIEKVIREVQKDVNAASKAIESMETSVKNGNTASLEAEVVFNGIQTSSSENFEMSKQIKDVTENQKEVISNTVRNIEKIVVVSEETASGTEEIASSTKELSQGMNEVTATSRDLADVANQLQDSVSRFKLKK